MTVLLVSPEAFPLGTQDPHSYNAMSYEAQFSSTLFRVQGPSGWVFAPVPEEFAPTVTEAWGRSPVVATVDGQTWKTSVWRERSGRTILAVPKRIRRGKDDGDVVDVRLQFNHV